MPRIIAHLDMDAFFASVEEREKPYLHGMPIVVGSDPLEGEGRGVVSTANYLARKYGIRSATPISQAWRLSEEAKKRGEAPVIFITPNFRKYSEASAHVMSIIGKYAQDIEEASIDEAYFDLSFTGSYKKAEALCKKIKKEIKQNEYLTASIGVGPNKLVAKIASDFKKPDGLTVVSEQQAASFLAPLSIRKISGIGPKTAELFLKRKITTIQDARKLTKGELTQMLGKWGTSLYGKLRGEDDSPLAKPEPPKSIGEQETFLKDTHNLNDVLPCIEKMTQRIWKSITRSGFSGFKTLVVIVRFNDFKTASRAHTFKQPILSGKIFERETLQRILPFLDSRGNPKNKLIRLVGIRAEKLTFSKK